MRDILKAIFTEYSVQFWQKIKNKSEEQDNKIQTLDDTIQEVSSNIGSVMIGDSIDSATPNKILFKVLEETP